MRATLSLAAIVTALLLPLSVFALGGINGSRLTIIGIVQEVNMTSNQKFNNDGADVVVKAQNGQLVHVKVSLDSHISYLGTSSRRVLTPVDIEVGRQARITGIRIDPSTMTSSLFILINAEKDQQLTNSGIITSIGQGTVNVLLVNGGTQTLKVDNTTEIDINYQAFGSDALSLLGKNVFYTLNPLDTTQAKILRITKTTQGTIPSASMIGQ